MTTPWICRQGVHAGITCKVQTTPGSHWRPQSIQLLPLCRSITPYRGLLLTAAVLPVRDALWAKALSPLVTALMDPAAKCQAIPDAILAASSCALAAAIVDLVAVLTWVVVQTNSDELVDRHGAVPEWACTARLDRTRNIDMCTQNTPQRGIRVKSAIYHCALVEEIIVAPPHGLCNNAYCPACRDPRHCVCADGDEGRPRLVMIVRSTLMQQSSIWRTESRTSTNQGRSVVRWLCLSDAMALASKKCTVGQPKAQMQQL